MISNSYKQLLLIIIILLQLIDIAKDPLWVHSISYIPLLRYNEGLSSLLSEYFPEGVGISPLTNKTDNELGNHTNTNI